MGKNAGKNGKLISNLITGGMVITLTLLVFFLAQGDGNKTYLDWASFWFALVAEVGLFGFLAYMAVQNTSPARLLVKTAMLSVLVLYWLLTVALALFRNSFANHLQLFTIVNVGIIALVVILLIVLRGVGAKLIAANDTGTN